MRAFAPSLLAGAAQLGLSRIGGENVFSPGARLPGLKNSYLSKLGPAQNTEVRQFGFGDRISVPISTLEAQFTSSLSSTVSGLYARAASLKSAASTLVSGTSGGIFDRRTTSTTSTTVSAEARSGAALRTYELDVQQLAVAQQNLGSPLLTSLTPADVTAGTHSFDITTVTGTTGVNVTVIAGDTNLQALSRIRDAINAAGAGIEASVLQTDDVSQLALTASRTGTGAAFAVMDTSGSIIATSGTGTTTRVGQDAHARVNGVEQTLQENRVVINTASDGTALTIAFFRGMTAGVVRVNVTVALDSGAVVSATSRLTRAINDLRDYVEDKPQILSPGLLARLNLAAADLREMLADVGIGSSPIGDFSVDEQVLYQSLAERPAQVERVIGSIQGLASRERSVAQTILESSALAFATRPGPLGATYGRFLIETARLHQYVAGGLFVNVLV